MARTLAQLSRIPVTELHGVGEKRQSALEEFGIESVLDLLMHYPRRYVDRTNEAGIDEVAIGEEALIVAEVENVSQRRMANRRSLVELKINDGSARMTVTFFNQPWRAKQLAVGRTAAFFGKVDAYRGRKQLTNPVVDLVGDVTGRIVPLYPQSEKSGLMSWELAKMIEESLSRAGEFVDPLPEVVRDELDLVDRTWAMHQIHMPESIAAARSARRRLAFDELFRLQTVLVMRKRAIERDSVGIAHTTDGPLLTEFYESLPFSLTGAQQRAITEIGHDMAETTPMHRLLQGDVGAGKTLVAVATMLMAVQGGYQAAIMAPTEVLAEQHAAGIQSLLRELTVADDRSLLGERPVRAVLLTSQTTASERSQMLDDLVSGDIDIVIGTHALLTEDVKFRALGAVVIDEQHRFGVEQRAALRGKGTDPDVLVMTATPIPRTAAMTVYGDLDTTVLDELPPGRTPIKTQWAHDSELSGVWEKVRSEVAAGRQGYVVCPLIDESEKLQAKSARDTYAQLEVGELKGLRLGLLHGQLSSKEKDAVMTEFRSGSIDVLVATTVIEVGVDVPNATVMVIESADRFGIAQLHQLRGRVGRGADESYCFLLSDDATPDGVARLEAMERTTDGFELAEVDLELRGEGTILGTKQKGRSDLRLASLRSDKDLIISARETAFSIVDVDTDLRKHPELANEIRDVIDDEEAEFLFKS